MGELTVFSAEIMPDDFEIPEGYVLSMGGRMTQYHISAEVINFAMFALEGKTGYGVELLSIPPNVKITDVQEDGVGGFYIWTEDLNGKS